MRLYCDCIPTTKKVSDCIPTVIMPGLYSDCNCPILNTVGILYQNSIVVKEAREGGYRGEVLILSPSINN